MDRPRLLLSTAYAAGRNYIEAFSSHGFECFADYLPEDTGFDALVLCGGGDIDPSFYCEENFASSPADLSRDMAEFRLFERYFAMEKPIIGICRGCQLINVALGGSLVQHLETSASHSALWGVDSVHTVSNCENSIFEELYGKEMTVNSAHHQSCARIADGLEVVQKHPDGTVEAVVGKNILAFQWHPERMTASFRNERYSDVSVLFGMMKNMIIKK